MKVNYCDELLIFPTVAKKSLKSEFIGFEKHESLLSVEC